MKTFIFFYLLLVCTTAEAKLFSNDYLSFELPTNWRCKREGFEHTCVNKFAKKQKKAIIILAAKKKGPQDNIPSYISHLKTQRTNKNYKGIPYKSKLKVLKKRKINGVNWIDSVHLGSEVQTYYTRYAATVVGELGILVSFSAHKDHYSKFSQDFMDAIQSLKVIAPKDLGSFKSAKIKGAKRDLFEGGLSDVMPEGLYGGLEDENESTSSLSAFFQAFGKKGLIGILLLLLTALGVFIYTKSR